MKQDQMTRPQKIKHKPTLPMLSMFGSDLAIIETTSGRVTWRLCQRYRRVGLNACEADNLAVMYGYHPAELWGWTAYDAAEDLYALESGITE